MTEPGDTMRCWLLLEKSDATRTSKGIDGYRDKTGEEYVYDSLVQNHKNVKAGDLALIRKEDRILGFGEVASVTVRDAEKIHRRCPECSGTGIRERKNLQPKWKCAKCSVAFTDPVETKKEVQEYTAKISNFGQIEEPPSVAEVKGCATSAAGQASQLSILELDQEAITKIIDGVTLRRPVGAENGAAVGQGIGLSYPERRAVELYAMRIARQIYSDAGWQVVDKSTTEPYDLLATKGNERRYIEVKGTTGAGDNVILTRGEVDHARSHPGEVALFVVGSILLEYSGDSWTGTDGTIVVHADPWELDESGLKATQFRYEAVKQGPTE